MSGTEPTDDSRLLRLDTCAVSDALDKLKIAGTVTGLLPLTTAKKIAGRVITVKLVAAHQDDDRSRPITHLGAKAIEVAWRGDIIVVEQRTGVVAGSWGGILSIGAKMRGVAGVIADGFVRDIDEARGIDFPIYGRGATALTARGRVVERETGGAVQVGNVRVRSGDFVIADSTGVVFVPADHLHRVLDTAEHIAAREFAMSKALLSGERITAVMGADYERMLQS